MASRKGAQAGGGVGGALGGVAGTIFGGPGGGALGKAIGSAAGATLGGLFGKNREKQLQEELQDIAGKKPGKVQMGPTGVGAQAAAQQMMMAPGTDPRARLGVAEGAMEAQGRAAGEAQAQHIKDFYGQQGDLLRSKARELEEARMEEQSADPIGGVLQSLGSEEMADFIAEKRAVGSDDAASSIRERMAGAKTATAAGGATPDKASGVVGDMSMAEFEEFLKGIMSGPGEVYVPPEGTA